MTNMINIIKATNNKNIIVTSHADNFKIHRTPYDVAALLSTLGMNKNLALAAMKENVESVLKSAIHRQFFKGTIK
jgi:RNase P/RNase MRP subunit p30